jgi:predicted nuclease of predicted toxin-antitoxin system
MTLALYMDEHIESVITEQLAIRGINVLTVQQDGRTRQPDDVILARAYELRRVVVTQDADYFGVATNTNAAGGDH